MGHVVCRVLEYSKITMWNSNMEDFLKFIIDMGLYLELHWIRASFFVFTLVLYLIRPFRNWVVRCFQDIYSSISHEFGHTILDYAFGGFIFASGVSAHNVYTTGLTWTNFIPWIVVPFGKIKRGKKYSLLNDHKLSIFFKCRSIVALAYSNYNKVTPPKYISGRFKKDAVNDFLCEFFAAQLDLLHETLRTGFNHRGKAEFTASLIFFNKSKGEWVKWGTFYSSNVNEPRKSKTRWPLASSRFELDQEFYFRRKQFPYIKNKLSSEGYEEVLQVPIYFSEKSKEETDEIYCVISYTSTKEQTLSKIDISIYDKFFAMEKSLVERFAYKIYKSYNF